MEPREKMLKLPEAKCRVRQTRLIMLLGSLKEGRMELQQEGKDQSIELNKELEKIISKSTL